MGFDATSLGAVAGWASAVVQGIQLAYTHRVGRKADATELKDENELALRLWGAVLFELRAGIERVRLIEEKRKEEGVTFGTFDFQICDALLPELYRIVSTPAILDRFRRIVSMLRRVDFFQRAASAAPLLSEGVDGRYGRAIGFAHDALTKGIVADFNFLVRVGQNIGEATFGDGWLAASAGMLPAQIDPSKPVDYSLV